MSKMMPRVLVGAFLLLMALLVLPAVAHAATISINGTTRDFAPNETLQEALATADAGANIVVSIESGETLVGVGGAARHYETFPANLGSIVFTGGGTFTPTMGSGSTNLYMYFHGVPVTLDGITFTGTVYGGTPSGINSVGALTSTNISLNNSTVTVGVVGGSVDANVGTVGINIAGSSVGDGALTGGNRGDEMHSITGGTIGTVNIAIASGNFGYIYGGGAANTTVGNTNIVMAAGAAQYVFGGSPAGSGHVDATSVVLSGNAAVSVNVFGGGDVGSTTGETNVLMNGGSVGNSIYAGGHTNTTETGSIGIAGGTVASRVAAGGFAGTVGESTVVIGGGTVGQVYGGGHNGGTVGNASVAITNGPYSITTISTGGTSLGLVQNSRILVDATIDNVMNLVVEEGHTLLMEEGSQVTTLPSATINNAGIFVTHGPLTSNGALINNGSLVVSSDGALNTNGEIEGSGAILFRQITSESDGQTYVLNSGTNLTIGEESGAAIDLVSVEVDGVPVSADDVAVGSVPNNTTVMLTSAFLDTLGLGEHTIRLTYADTSHADGTFVVAPAIETPEGPGDEGSKSGTGYSGGYPATLDAGKSLTSTHDGVNGTLFAFLAATSSVLCVGTLAARRCFTVKGE